MTTPDGAARAPLRPIRRINPRSVATATALVLAALVVTIEPPVAVRIPALLVLLLLPGVTLVRLLVGDKADSTVGQAVRAPLSVLLGVLIWLAVALLLNAFGAPLGTRSALGVGAVGLALVTVDGTRRRPPPHRRTPQAITTRVMTTIRSGTSVAVAAAVIVAATVVAAKTITKPDERYTTLGFVDDKPFGGEVPVVARGDAVRLNWVLRGFGCVPSPVLTSVRLAVDGDAIGAVAVDIASDPVGTLIGAVTFTAPARPGRHFVELAVRPAGEGGTPLPEPGYVSTFLEVGI